MVEDQSGNRMVRDCARIVGPTQHTTRNCARSRSIVVVSSIRFRSVCGCMLVLCVCTDELQQDSLELFETICSEPMFHRTPIILIFNKVGNTNML